MKKYVSFCILFLISFVVGVTSIKAASLSISASTQNVVRGGTVIIRITASDVVGKVSLTTSDPGVLSGGTSNVWIENETQTYTFKANSAGTATVTVNAIDLSDGSGNPYTTSRSVTINVYNPAPVVLSSNNNLASLGIEGKEIIPGFSQDTLEYSVEMDPETTKVNITGKVADGSASVVGLGEREVTDGDNRLEIIVTAQNGTKKTYILNVKVQEYNPIEVNIDSGKYTVIRKQSQLEAPPNYTATTIKIGEEDIHAFHSDITGYTLVGLKAEAGNIALYVYENGEYALYKEYQFNKVILYPMEVKDKIIPSEYKKTTITLNDEKIVAYKIDTASNYALVYGMNVETGKVNLYMYDEEEHTLQIYTREEVEKLAEKLDTYTMMIAILSGTSAFLLIVCILLLIRKHKKNNDKNTIKVKQVNENKKERKLEEQLAKEILENDDF